MSALSHTKTELSELAGALQSEIEEFSSDVERKLEDWSSRLADAAVDEDWDEVSCIQDEIRTTYVGL